MFQGATPLIVAAMGGDTATTKQLLEGGAKVNAQQADGSTALRQAAQEGYTAIVDLLLQKGAEVDARDWLGTTPLMAAAMGSHLETVKSLLAHGADVNARDDNVRRAYGQAQFNGDTRAQKAIEDSGQLNVRHQDGASALAWAKLSRNIELIKLLLQAGAK